jgi:hypothetical protein
LVIPLGAEGDGGAEGEEVAVALFELGAGGPLMDRGSPQMDEVAGLLAVVVAEVDGEVDGAGARTK